MWSAKFFQCGSLPKKIIGDREASSDAADAKSMTDFEAL
jgi:hypothetical protein